MKEIFVRALSGSVYAFAIIGSLLYNEIIFYSILLLFVGLAVFEFEKLTNNKSFFSYIFLIIIWGSFIDKMSFGHFKLKFGICIFFNALIIAVVIRSLFIQPFYIPSSSMEPSLLVGDRLFVTKYSYGYSKHSFPFSLPIFKKRIMFNDPDRGDVIVFKTPADNR